MNPHQRCSRNMYLYNAYISTYILLQAKVKYRNEPKTGNAKE